MIGIGTLSDLKRIYESPEMIKRRLVAQRAVEFDKIIVTKVKEYRKIKGLTQSGLAAKLGIVFHQVWKYEAGINRIAGGRLAHISEVLEIPLANFFEGLGSTKLNLTNDRLRLLRAYNKLSPQNQRFIVRLLTRA